MQRKPCAVFLAHRVLFKDDTQKCYEIYAIYRVRAIGLYYYFWVGKIPTDSNVTVCAALK